MPQQVGHAHDALYSAVFGNGHVAKFSFGHAIEHLMGIVIPRTGLDRPRCNSGNGPRIEPIVACGDITHDIAFRNNAVQTAIRIQDQQKANPPVRHDLGRSSDGGIRLYGEWVRVIFQYFRKAH
ncbi:MAG: hypothetical protein RKK11_19185 [Alphaproteobacteria bacterium]